MATSTSAQPDRNLALELVRVTEAAALAAARWMGRGDKNGADGAAVDAMRIVLSTVPMDGIVVIGEGEKDEAPMLFNGERIGDGTGPATDIAVDPIDGTTLTALGRGNAHRRHRGQRAGHDVRPGPVRLHGEDRRRPRVRRRRRPRRDRHREPRRPWPRPRASRVRDVTAVILDRDRHDDLIAEVREAGARIRLIPDGDVAGAISTAWPDSGADILFGIGGTPEGVIAAAALKCMGGEMQGRLWPRNDEERDAAARRRLRPRPGARPPTTSCAGDNCFFAATGITDGELLKGVHYDRRGATTQSLVMRSRSGTVRLINARHNLSKLGAFSAIEFE